ncbi:MAG: MFS transporter [Actinomycetota bacterium]|nr:MFS transporter [Actinomycetota bacterium]
MSTDFSAAAATAAGRSRAGGPRPGLALVLIATAQLMVYLDTTIVNVALPHIQRAFNFSGSGLEWVVNAYAVSFGGLLLLGGRSGDRLGRKKVFVGGTLLFATASLAGGLADSQAWLLTARAVQGLGAALIAPATLSLVNTTFAAGAQRTRATAVYSGASAAGGAVGLIAGGLLVNYLSWRWVLFVNVPIGYGLALGAQRAFTESRRLRGRFDIPGAVTGCGGIASLVYGLANAVGSIHGAANWAAADVAGPLCAAAVLLGSFVVIELRSKDPLLPPRLVRDRNRGGAYLIILCVGTALYGIFFFLTIFMQVVWGYSALKTAAAYLPMVCAVVGLSAVCATALPRIGARPLLLAGAALSAGGLLWMSRITEHGNYGELVVPMLVATAGLGMMFVPMNLVAMTRVESSDVGVASSMLNACEQVGGSIGLAVLGTVAWTAVAGSLRSQLGHARQPVTGPIPVTVYDHALAAGFSTGFEVAAGVAGLALLITVVFIRVTRQDTAGARLPGPG